MLSGWSTILVDLNIWSAVIASRLREGRDLSSASHWRVATTPQRWRSGLGKLRPGSPVPYLAGQPAGAKKLDQLDRHENASSGSSRGVLDTPPAKGPRVLGESRGPLRPVCGAAQRGLNRGAQRRMRRGPGGAGADSGGASPSRRLGESRAPRRSTWGGLCAPFSNRVRSRADE
jgi:hypothetical protein